MSFYSSLFINGLRKKKRKLLVSGLQKGKRKLKGKRIKYPLKHYYFITIFFCLIFTTNLHRPCVVRNTIWPFKHLDNYRVGCLSPT
jgi:hypothetical protein